MAKRKRSALLPENTALLQNLVKRDPSAYAKEFTEQYQHYESQRNLFLLNPAGDGCETESFLNSVGFIANVCSNFPTETAKFPEELSHILRTQHHQLPPDVREKLIQSLVLLRNKDVITPDTLIQVLFPVLVETTAKFTRAQIYSAIVSLLKAANHGAKNQKLNRTMQALLFNLLDESEANGLWATKLTRELWKRGIWDDSRTVELMVQAALNDNLKVSSSAVRFFLGADKERDETTENQSGDEDDLDINALRHKMQINKKTGRRGKKMESALKQLKKKGSNRHSATYLNFSAIHLLRDPQGFADALFDKYLTSKNSRKLDIQQRILITNLVSRLIGTHKLHVLGIYSFLEKLMTPKQENVTQFMAAAAQASHDLVPPDVISPLIRKIADEFVSDGVSSEVAAAGLNTIREILARAPLSIDETLLQDLVTYKGSKSKSVTMAARSLLGLYREIAPEMLARKDRGKTASIEMQHGEKRELRYGIESNVVTGIQGIDLLQKWQENREAGGEDSEEEDGWEIASEESEDDSDEGDWINMESDKEYSVSDSEDDDVENKRNRNKKLKRNNKNDMDEDQENDDNEDEQNNKKRKLTREELILERTKAEEEAFIKLASTRVLTPADFQKLEELRTQAGLEKIMGKSVRKSMGLNEETVEADNLIGSKKYKQNKKERLAHVEEGREGRREFGSRKGKRENARSTTNKEKARKKNIMMMIHKKDVQGKAKRSLKEKQKVLRQHITTQKKKGF
ncbi:uncharacterized protein SAPINGB_P003829 [Magnusiomyces paraingens]|uniref:Protein SDA1 n=1 Tax=Magnusiomyces paraingens TaxID=2606893 RepID=A0A5E8BYS5_9ASCO|nr:uncharacterized protein SAPINGB_P003829 [Saprochaete ingens]VVT53945.1 unnamed protein product [Saprochaete ingens]